MDDEYDEQVEAAKSLKGEISSLTQPKFTDTQVDAAYNYVSLLPHLVSSIEKQFKTIIRNKDYKDDVINTLATKLKTNKIVKEMVLAFLEYKPYKGKPAVDLGGGYFHPKLRAYMQAGGGRKKTRKTRKSKSKTAKRRKNKNKK